MNFDTTLAAIIKAIDKASFYKVSNRYLPEVLIELDAQIQTYERLYDKTLQLIQKVAAK